MLLAFDGVACIRGDRLLFRDLSFMIAAGDALWLCGPNGAGKSSLLRLAVGLLPIAAGRVTLPPPSPPFARAAALADERLALDPELTLAAALDFWARIDGGDVPAAMAAMALTPLADIPVALLSTGQRKRAALARTIASGAALWLLDEPGNGLDAASLGLLTAAVAAHRARGGAVILTSHFDLALPDQRQWTLAGAA